MTSVTTPLRCAESLLRTPDGGLPPRNALAAAFGHVWAATVWRTDLTPELRDRADDLYDVMFSHGPIHRTAERMTDDEAASALRAVREFIAAVEASADVPEAVRRRAERYVSPVRRFLG